MHAEPLGLRGAQVGNLCLSESQSWVPLFIFVSAVTGLSLRDLRRGSAAARLLGLWIRIVSCACCHVEVSGSGWSLIERSPTECGVSECDHEFLTMRRPFPLRAVASW